MKSMWIYSRYLRSVSLGAVTLAFFSGGAEVSLAATPHGEAEVQSSPQPNSSDQYGVAPIVVTARRVAENLQDVPQTVTAVTSDTVEKLALTQFQDVAAVVPGLTLGNGSAATGGFAAPSIRGVPYDFIASSSPTVDIYLNEVPFEARLAFAGIFDIGDIQVLQGPQGTARGRTAPSGAILISSRRPDLEEFGGTITGLAATHAEYNVQGALNVPVIPGVLGIRAAGLYNSTEGNFVRSVNSTVDPHQRDLAGRLSVLFEPSPDFDAQVTYQHADQNVTSFSPVTGSGSAGALNSDGTANPFAPPNFNGPALTAADRRGVDDFPSQFDFKYDLVTGQANANLFGHRLSYVGGYLETRFHNVASQDPGNLIQGVGVFQDSRQKSYTISQEVRIASEPGQFLDYTLGYYFFKNKGDSTNPQTQVYLPGAFGPVEPYDPSALNFRYTLPLVTTAPGQRTENSFFATATLHPGPKTELTLGGRYLILKQSNQILVNLGGGYAVATPSFGFPCDALAPGLVASDYPGYCDFPVPAPGIVGDFRRSQKEKPFVYNASVSHRFTDDILAYGTIASSYRLGFFNIGVNNGDNDPLLQRLAFPTPEKSTSFEVGLKTSWLDNRLRINVAAFYQKFKDMLFQTQAVPYLSVAGPARQVSSFGFNVNADAIVKGFNLDVAFQPSRNFSLSAGLAYAKARVDDDDVPCRDVNFDGVPDAVGSPTVAQFDAAGVYVATCRTNETITRDPFWKGTLQSEWLQPINSVAEGYVRGLLTYNSSNPNKNAGFKVDSYALLNLYAGVRSPDGAWDLGLFLRNVTNTGEQLSRGEDDVNQSGAIPFGLAGYRSTTYTPPRQFGISLRYAFGSR